MNCPKCRTVNPAGTRFCGHCGLDLRPSDFPTATLSTSMREIARGSLIAGRYEIIEEIGAGGMGRVFKAYDRRLQEPVAVKIIRPEIGADAQAMERFDNEIRLARRIAHKNVARMFDVGEDEGTSYITMEYVSGEDLRGLIQRIGWLPIAKVLAVGRQIAEGLAEAHALGIIHRDLKPHNIMIDREGNARIMDFGIARFVKTKRMTEVGMLVGTPEYMPPEQIEGGDADARSDIYSLGIILYEMTTGRLPFTGDTPLAVAMKQKGALPAPPRSLNAETPPSLNGLILRCLEKKPDKRFPTAAALAAALAAIERDLSTAERAVPLPVHRPTRDVTIHFNIRRVITPVAALALLAAAAGGIWWALARPGAPTAVPAERPRTNAAASPASPSDGPSPEKPAEKVGVVGSPDSGRPAEGSSGADRNPGESQNPAPQPLPAGEKAPAAKPPTTPPLLKPAASPGMAPAAPKPSPAESALARSRSAWARGDAEAAASSAREALAADSGNAEARRMLEAAEKRLDEKAIADLVVLYDQALDGNRLPAFYRTYGSPALAAEVRQDAETVAALFSRFDSSVSGQRLTWSGRDAAEISFEHKLLGYAKEGGAEQALFQGRLSWKVEKRQGRWVIASIRTGS